MSLELYAFQTIIKNLHQYTKSLPQIVATAPKIGTLFFTADTERPEEAPVVASKKSVPIEGYSE
jgi:hypothetical protein